MADQYHIDSNIVTTSDSIEPVAGLVVNSTMTDSQSVISNVTTGGVGAKGDKGDKGDTGATGLKGDKGDTGLTGAAGTNGQGVPTGGTTGQQLAKINGTDYNTQWVNPVDISGKQDTLVSGTSIKTVNSTSLLGSGDIVVAAGSDPLKEDVANKSTATTLGTSDTLYPSQKAVKTYVDTTAGAYVPLAGGTMTGTLNTQTLLPTANLTYNLGGTSNYNLNTYTQKLYLNSTAYLDGSVAGIVNISGGIKVTNSSTFSSPITVNSLSTGTAIDIRTPLNAFGESIYMTIQTRARIGYDGTGLVLDDNNTNKRVRISSNSRSWDFSTAGSFVAPGDMEITDSAKGVILKSPNGSRWRVTIDNTGALTTTSI